METIRERGKKLVSATLSVLLVALLLPVYTPARGYAAESGSASGAAQNPPKLKLSTDWFEGEADELNTFTQEKPLEALFAATDDEATKPDVTEIAYGADGNADLTAAVDALVAENGGIAGSADNVQVEWVSFDDADPSMTNPDEAASSEADANADATDEKALRVEKTDQGDWKFVAEKATDESGAPVYIDITKATVKVSFDYKKPAESAGGDAGEGGNTDNPGEGGNAGAGGEAGAGSGSAGDAGANGAGSSSAASGASQGGNAGGEGAGQSGASRSSAGDGDTGQTPGEGGSSEGGSAVDPTPAEPTTEQASIDSVALNDIHAKASYSIVVNDAFAADEEAVSDALFGGFTLAYGGSSEAKSSEVLKYASYTVEVANDYQDNFDVAASFAEGKLDISVEPKNAAEGEKTATLKITAQGGKTWNQQISVWVSKKPISFTGQPQQYRLQVDQLTHVKDVLKAEAKLQLVGSDSVDSVINLDNAAFQAYPGEQGGSFMLSGIALANNATASNYELANDSVNVNVSAVQQSASDEVSGFAVSGKKGDGTTVDIPQNGDAVWVASSPVAKWDDHSVSATLDGSYGDTLALDSSAKGVYANQLLYAKDSDDVISKVTGISYRLDPDAPRIKSFSIAEQPKSIFSGNLFFSSKADVTIAVTDEIGVDQFDQDVANPGVSGLSAEGAKVTYHDDHANASHEVSDFSVSGSTGSFKFAIDGDQDAATKSFAATVTDNAGNTMVADSVDALQVPDDVMRLVADAAAPELSLAFDNNDASNGKYYKAARTATITIKEAHFDYVRKYDPSQAIVKIVENGEARYLTPDAFQKVGDDTWQASVRCANNSDYEVYAQVTDLVGKASGVKSDAFTVDTASPALTVSFDNDNATNGMYYNAARTAMVTVVDHNFSENLFEIAPTSAAGNGAEAGAASVSGWTTYGDTHIARVAFPGQGVYTLSVSGQDLASNQAASYTCPEFVIDTEKPVISISVGGQADASSHAYSKDAALEVTVDDTNVSAATTIDLDGIGLGTSVSAYAQNRADSATRITVSAASPAEKAENDGVYRVNVNAVDMAGNTETKTVDWSVNRFGSTFVLSDATKDMVAKQYLTDKALKDVAVTEINPSGVSADSVSVQIAKGTSSSVLSNGSGFTFDSAGDSNGWPAYSYVISRDNYKSDAAYQTVLHSQDAAGLVAENTMAGKNENRTGAADIAFAVDNTAPIVSFSGFDEAVVADTKHPVNVHIEDNLLLDHAVVKVNDEVALELDADELAKSSDHEVVLGESQQDQRVTVEAYDAAGNMEPATSDAVFVNSDPIARLMHNTVLFVVAIFALVAVVCLGGWLVYRRAQKRGDN